MITEYNPIIQVSSCDSVSDRVMVKFAAGELCEIFICKDFVEIHSNFTLQAFVDYLFHLDEKRLINGLIARNTNFLNRIILI